MAIKRVFLIVLDSAGIGELPDAADFGDLGSNTFGALAASGALDVPNMARLGLFHIDGVSFGSPVGSPVGCFGKLGERSMGKDTTVGHWEIAGLSSPRALPTFPGGFPRELIDELTRVTGRKILCNKPYSGTAVIAEYGREQVETGALIVYTSADSVLQIAAHEQVVPVDQLYRICEQARELLKGDWGVGRVIARPFEGEHPHFTRTANRHDFSLEPPGHTMCDLLMQAGLASIGVGKIYDIFAGRGISETIRIQGNEDGMNKTLALQDKDFTGLCFVNLVDFDMLYGHRNDVPGYTAAMNAFDKQLGRFLPRMRRDDLLMITADHGCDPSTPSTDHSREYVPLLVWGEQAKQGVNLGVGDTFADIAATVQDLFGLPVRTEGTSLRDRIL